MATETQTNFVYPKARRDDIIEDYHGTQVADPYRWMEDPNALETQEWVEAENVITQKYLAAIPAREKIKERLTALWNFPRFSVPFKEGSRYFFFKNNGLQNQDVLYMQTSLEAEPVEVLDPNQFSGDGTIALSNLSFSEDGSLMLYGTSQSGSDWQELHIRPISDNGSGEDFPEVIKYTKFSHIAWKSDNSGFFYARYPDPATVAVDEQSNNQKVYWHRVNTPQSEDTVIYARPDAPELGFQPIITDDQQYLVLSVWHGTAVQNRFYYRKLDSQGDFVRLLDAEDARYDFVGNAGSVFYFDTDLNAPKARIVATDVAKFEQGGQIEWQEILPEQPDPLSTVALINHQLVVAYLHDVHHDVKIFNLDGAFVRDLALPTLGTVGGFSGKPEDTEMFFGFDSFLYPTQVFHFDFNSGELKLFRKPQLDFDADAYETRQVFYNSKDGTRVPMFILCKKNLELNGDNPTILYGYGGFAVGTLPGFRVMRAAWLESGGVYAIANLRGGSEYGEEWHQAGMLEKKQNVFDDFIAAGEWLIANKYTSTKRLAIQGGSNGGLLVAACMLQRPELFGAVICQVPVIDMLRYHKFTVGRFWTSEYGNAEANAEQFKFMFAYSPLHNIKEGVTYPPLLITTADTDDRVVPMHSKKFAATLQAAAQGESVNPLLIRIETKAGHGAGKPTAKLIEEVSDELAFLFKIFEMT